MRLSIVIPVYNERATIIELLDRVAAVDLDTEVIVVDDGSTDWTLAAHARRGTPDDPADRTFARVRSPVLVYSEFSVDNSACRKTSCVAPSARSGG